QWSPFLTLPAFMHKPRNPMPVDFLAIADFVNVLQQQWTSLAASHQFYALNGHIKCISLAPRGYQIELDDEEKTTITAPSVNICGGPGPENRLKSPQFTDPQLIDEYTHGIPRLNTWPRLITGEMFLRHATPLPSSGSILIFGGGPTGAWC